MNFVVAIERTEVYLTEIDVEAASAEEARRVTQEALEADGYDDVCGDEDGDLEECVSSVIAVDNVTFPQAAAIPDAIRKALESLLEYEWVCERNDATDSRDEETGLIESTHIFRDIVTLRNWIDGTDTAPEEYVK